MRLSTVLAEAGLDPRAAWMLAEGADAAGMARSVPIAKALDDALLVYAQNGERLRPEQGYPLRLFLPGYEGNTNIKWLRRLKLGDGMSDTAVAAKKTVEVGKKQILDQRLRIERQHKLIARHERDGYPDLVADAVRTLGEMDRALARMEAHYVKTQEHLVEVTVDESSLAKVERETPM